MAVLHDVIEGETDRLKFTLKSKSVAFDLTGFTVSDLLITDAGGTAIDTAGDFGIVTAPGVDGLVYYDPDASDFVAQRGPYRVRFEVTDASGKKKYFPNGQADEIVVRAKR